MRLNNYFNKKVKTCAIFCLISKFKLLISSHSKCILLKYIKDSFFKSLNNNKQKPPL